MRVLGAEHGLTLASPADLAAWYTKAGRPDRAISVRQLLVADHEWLCATDPRGSGSSRVLLPRVRRMAEADTYRWVGRYRHARASAPRLNMKFWTW